MAGEGMAMQADAEKTTTQPQPGSDGDFSLVLGGPLYQLLLKTRLVRPPLELLHRRLIAIPLVAWLPLLVLTLVEGTAYSGVAVPFLHDVEAYVRFLVAIPILIVAEVVVHQRMRPIIEQFRERDIVSAESQDRLEAAMRSARRWRSSYGAELALLVVVFVLGPLSARSLALAADTWSVQVVGGESSPTWAGLWFFHVSVPIFQFLLLRWYLRLVIWGRFLWQVSRLPLTLKALHPDRAGGLGFLAASIDAFTLVLVAQSVQISGLLFSKVINGVGTALEYRDEIGLVVVFLTAQVTVPLLFFVPDLVAARRSGLRRFGMLATTYAAEFERKWMHGPRDDGEELLGSGDIQSLNDLAGAHEVVREMRPFPFNARVMIRTMVVCALPFFPLVLTVIPLGDLIQKLAGMLL
jgi:hypothetical protein